MAGAATITLTRDGMGELRALFKRALALPDSAEMWAAIGAAGESVTRRRLQDSANRASGAAWANAGPLGETWPAWSSKYAARRPQGKSLLAGEGALHEGIIFDSGSDYAAWGADSGVIYAATHQYGDDSRNIPARPFVGFGPQEKTAIAEVLQAAIAAALQ